MTANAATLATVALLAWTGTILQSWITIHTALNQGRMVVEAVLDLLSYFTILTNLFIALACSAALVSGKTRLGRWFSKPSVLGCATTAILFLAIVYQLLLRHTWNPEGPQWLADKIQHYAVPMGMGLIWCCSRFDTKLSLKTPLVWCLYPVGYLGYVILRGASAGSYPYDFVNFSRIGWKQGLVNGLGLLVAFVLVGAVVQVISLIRTQRVQSSDTG